MDVDYLIDRLLIKKEKVDLYLDSVNRNVLSSLAEASDVLLQISVHVLKNKVEHRPAFLVLALFDIHQPNNMGIAREHAQDGDLPESGGGYAFIVLVETSLLESNDLPSCLLSCSVYFPKMLLNSIGTNQIQFKQLLNSYIFLWDSA